MFDKIDASICKKAKGRWNGKDGTCELRNKNIYRIIESFPQATVKLVHFVIIKNKKDLEDAKENPGDMAFETEIDIDYGGEARTESIIKLRK